jgi:glycosyltransferase involved in cell wall biosynthesis
MKKINKLKVSICIPIYNGSQTLKKTLLSLFKQKVNFEYEIIFGDDNPPGLIHEINITKRIIDSFNKKVIYYKNSKNIGSALNIRKLSQTARNDIIFFLCQDDILSKDALQKTYDAFLLDNKVGVVTRPYFWFINKINKPIRAVTPYDVNHTSILSLTNNKRAFVKIFESIGQLSGLAFKKKTIDIPFGNECFTGHIYPFASILKKYKCVYLKNYTVAVKLADSQSRNVSSIYDISPVASWINMFNNVYSENKYHQFKEWGIEQATTNFVGLVQIKNYAKKGLFKREIGILLRSRWKNIFEPKFWFYSALCYILPKKWLILLSDKYKIFINAKKLPKINFESYK